MTRGDSFEASCLSLSIQGFAICFDPLQQSMLQREGFFDVNKIL